MTRPKNAKMSLVSGGKEKKKKYNKEREKEEKNPLSKHRKGKGISLIGSIGYTTAEHNGASLEFRPNFFKKMLKRNYARLLYCQNHRSNPF